MARKKSLAVSLACMAIYRPTPVFKGRIFKLCVLIQREKDGSHRMILNLRKLNEKIDKIYLKMESETCDRVDEEVRFLCLYRLEKTSLLICKTSTCIQKILQIFDSWTGF